MNTKFKLPNIISEFKCSLALAAPLVAAEVIYALNSFIATVMVARLGKVELAANALVWTIYLAVILFFIGVLCAISIMVAQSYGAKDNKSVGVCFKQGIILSIIFTFPMMLIMWLAPNILIWAKQDPEVIACAKPFFYSLIWSMLPLNLWVAMQQFSVGITKAKIVMFSTILSVPIEIFFYYGFLFGKFGFPKTGLAGIGYGLSISYSLMAILIGCYLYFSKPLKIYSLFKKWWIIDKKFFVEMFRVGMPLGVMWCSEVGFFAVVAVIMGLFGVATLAAFQIVDQYLMIALTILFALSQSVAVRTGNEVGRNDKDRLWLTFFVHLGIGISIILFFSLFYVFFPQLAISLDLDLSAEGSRDVVVKATRFFPIIGVLLITDCIRIIGNGVLRGLKDTTFQLLISVFGFWVITFPVVYLLGFKLKLGGVGVWWAIVVGLFITGLMLLMRFRYLMKTTDGLSFLVTRRDNNN